jgi:hypothetical protein
LLSLARAPAILHRSTVITCVLKADRLAGTSHNVADDSRTMGDALDELLACITEAARTIGTLLQTTTRRS